MALRLRPDPKRLDAFESESSDQDVPIGRDSLGKAAFVSIVGLVVVGLTLLVGNTSVAERWTPESPEVVQAVDRALAYLEKSQEAASESRTGAWALIGLALLKSHRPADHPLLVRSAEEIRKRVPPSGRPQDFPISTWDIYSTGLSLIFLCSYDPVRYRNDIQAILGYLVFRQKPHGGWGYPAGSPHELTGDTSMTQYAVLGCWEAVQAGIPVPGEVLNKVADWLIRTQDPGGGYAYQGQVGPGGQLISQSGVRIGMGIAGMSSVYVLASLAQMRRLSADEDEGLPPALQRIEEERSAGRLRLAISAAALRGTIQRGNAYIERSFQMPSGMYNYYYIYSVERYFTFRRLVEGKAEERIPWYDSGVDYLLKTQAADGSWNHQCGPVCDTAFGILFLVRSTKQSVERVRDFGAGVLVGGRGLPKDTDSAVVKNGQVVALPLRISVEELTAVLESPDAERAAAALDALQSMPRNEARLFVAKNADALRRLAGGDSRDAKLSAIAAIGNGGDLSLAPVLIDALSDPDPDTAIAADRALRRLTRRPGEGLAPGFSDTQRELRIREWKQWYQAIAPDAEFDR
ncbi:MAG: hypothetical protein Kow0040_04940 [Thermogutta sp.]